MVKSEEGRLGGRETHVTPVLPCHFYETLLKINRKNRHYNNIHARYHTSVYTTYIVISIWFLCFFEVCLTGITWMRF